MKKSREVFNTMANENDAIRAFKVNRDLPKVRESLHINPKIWGRLNEEIYAQIKAIQEELKPPDKKKHPSLS